MFISFHDPYMLVAMAMARLKRDLPLLKRRVVESWCLLFLACRKGTEIGRAHV